jgi:F-type H+-transporting ATPase subunit delta
VTDLSREYGDGLYALCMEEGIAKDVLEQLQALKNCFDEQPDFCRLLSNMSLSKQERVEIVDKTLRGQVHPYVLNFLKILCERGALHEFSGCEQAYRERYNHDHGVTEAVVTTCLPLTEDQRRKLLVKLGSMTGNRIDLYEKVDPQVLGGVLLEMNGKRYDSTLRCRLQSIHQALAGK